MAGFSGASGVPKKYVDDLVAQSTAYVTEYVNIGAEDMLAKIAQMSADTMIYFRTTSTTTNGPRSGIYLIGTAIRTGNNINISATDMANPSVIYQNGTNTGGTGTTWNGWTRNGCLVFGNDLGTTVVRWKNFLQIRAYKTYIARICILGYCKRCRNVFFYFPLGMQ